MYAFLLALYAAFCWGLAPLFGKVGMRGVDPLNALVARTIMTSCFILGLFLAKGDTGKLLAIPAKRWLLLGAEAFLATFVGDLAYYAAIKYGQIGQAALVLAASPLVTVLIGRVFLHERINGLQLVGAIMIIGGVALIGMNAATR